MENEHAEWMWTIPYLKRIFICVCKKIYSYVFLFCIDDNVEV